MTILLKTLDSIIAEMKLKPRPAPKKPSQAEAEFATRNWVRPPLR